MSGTQVINFLNWGMAKKKKKKKKVWQLGYDICILQVLFSRHGYGTKTSRKVLPILTWGFREDKDALLTGRSVLYVFLCSKEPESYSCTTDERSIETKSNHIETVHHTNKEVKQASRDR